MTTSETLDRDINKYPGSFNSAVLENINKKIKENDYVLKNINEKIKKFEIVEEGRRLKDGGTIGVSMEVPDESFIHIVDENLTKTQYLRTVAIDGTAERIFSVINSACVNCAYKRISVEAYKSAFSTTRVNTRLWCGKNFTDTNFPNCPDLAIATNPFTKEAILEKEMELEINRLNENFGIY